MGISDQTEAHVYVEVNTAWPARFSCAATAELAIQSCSPIPFAVHGAP
jgi:hypothetical protein